MIICLTSFISLLFCIAIVTYLVNFIRSYGRSTFPRQERTFAFFHPYCDGGGGGERVLWRAVATMQQRLPDWTIVIYTDNYTSNNAMLIGNVQTRFDIHVDAERIQFVRLRWCWMLQPANIATMLLQLIGGFLLGLEALWRFQPVILIDTVGAPTVLPVFKYVGRCLVGCYIHYPMISSEMIQRVVNGKEDYNNRKWISKRIIISMMKAFYYYDILRLYTFCIKRCDVIMTNGNWTNNHVMALLTGANKYSVVVYPPCDVQQLTDTADTEALEIMFNKQKRINILSVGQIRPEKNHYLQLAAFAEVKRLLQRRHLNLTLTIAGGVRGAEDEKRLSKLKQLATYKFNLTNGRDVIWMINASIDDLRDVLHNSMIGIHTMRSEHFGISVVEGMAAGNIMVAHNSGGPQMDIIGGYENAVSNPCGFLAVTAEEYAQKIVEIINLTRGRRNSIRHHAQSSAARFDNAHFDPSFVAAVNSLIE